MKRFFAIFAFILIAVAGFTVGRLTGEGHVLNTNIARRVFPMLPVPPKESVVPTANAGLAAEAPTKDIVLEVPVEGAILSGSFDVSGRARLTGTDIVVVVKDETGETLTENRAVVDTDEAGQFGRFSQTVSLPQHKLGKGTIEVYYASAVASAARAAFVRQVTFAEPDTVAAKVYFRTTGFDSSDSCDNVLPVERTVSSKGTIYRAVIDQLIDGPNDGERAAGYATALSTGVVLKSVAADANGVVTADFTSSLERGVAGSCRVTAIRAQIVSTLKQFPEVRDVVISVNGLTETVLQP
jgi:hypothetical protein